MARNYTDRADTFAETYGIITYKVSGRNMIFYANYYTDYTHKKAITYKCVVNLDTMKEKRTELKKLNRTGWENR